MDSELILVIVVATALAFDFTNGFHDTANAMATSIASGALRPRVAVMLAGLLNLIGAFLSVPVAALIAVAYRYGRDQLDGLAPEVGPDGTSAQLTGDSTGAKLVRRPADEEPPVIPDSEDVVAAVPVGATAGAPPARARGPLAAIGNARRLLRLHR